MPTITTLAPYEVRKPRSTLSVGWKRGPNSSNLAGDEQSDDSQEYDGVQQFEIALRAARNQWSIKRRSGGLFSLPGRLTKADAGKLLKAALAALAEGDSA